MEIETDDDILRKVASGGSMDYSAWPSLLIDIVARIEKIAHNDFPIPSIPPPSTAPPPPEPRFLAPLPSSDPIEPPPQQSGAATTTSASDSQDSSQDTNKENANPTASASTGPGPQPATGEAAAGTAGGTASPLEPGALPPQITAMLAEIKTTLVDGFPVYPPHTIQRLAELVLAPRQHYRSLPSYLHAVDRVVHVTSGNNIYPLPPAIPDMSAMSLLANGVGSSRDDSSRNSMAWANASAGAAVGSDEALGGALLTPIPWLQRRANGGSDASPSPSPPISEGSAAAAAAQNQGPAGAQASQQRGVQGAAAQSSPGAGNGGSGAGRQFEGQVRTESTETIDGPNGIGSIETVSISFNGIPSMGAARALTQGEILRQEQRAGVVPVSQLARASAAMTATASPLSAASSSSPASSAGEPTPTSTGSPGPSPSPEGAELTPSSADEEMANVGGDEVPHARGPEEIGAADTGPQNPTTSPYIVGSGGNVEMRGIDVEAAVGRKAEHSHSPDPDSSVSSALSPSSKREADVDIEATDAPAQKKLKEHEGDDVAGAGSDDAADGPSEEGEPKKDAEGDIELSDEVPEGSIDAGVETDAASTEAAGEASKE